MKRLVYLLIATCLVACAPPAQQAPVQQPVAAQPVANETVEPAKEPPIIKVGKVSVVGAMNEDIVRSQVRPKLSEILHCYESGLVATPTIAGNVTVHFQIGPNGWVTGANLRGYDSGNCVSEVFKSIQFPTPKNADYVNVKYAFTVLLAKETVTPK